MLINLVSLPQLWFGDAGFEVGDATVGEAVVLAGGGQDHGTTLASHTITGVPVRQPRNTAWFVYRCFTSQVGL